MLKAIAAATLSLSFLNGSPTWDVDRAWIIIFLDIDGVLFHESSGEDFWEKRKAKLVEIFGPMDNYDSFQWDMATSYFFHPESVLQLETLIDQAGLTHNVGIVLSSNWRVDRSLEQLHQVFAPYCFSQFIIDKTPEDLHTYSRADEIAYWLRQHSAMDIENFIILDDFDSGFSKRFPSQFVHIRHGVLSHVDAMKAWELIQSPFSPPPPTEPPILPQETTLESPDVLEEYIKRLLQGDGPIIFKVTCANTQDNRNQIATCIASLYAHFLTTESRDPLLREKWRWQEMGFLPCLKQTPSEKEYEDFAYYFKTNLIVAFSNRSSVHLGWGNKDGPLETAFSKTHLSSEYRNLFPYDSHSFIILHDDTLEISINLRLPLF